MLTPAEQKKLDTLKTKHVDGDGTYRKNTPKGTKDTIKHLMAKRDEPEQAAESEEPTTETSTAPTKKAAPAKNDPTLALRPKECPEHLTHLLDQGFTYVGASSRGWHYVKNANDLFRVDKEKGVLVPKRLSALSGWTPKLLKNLLK